MCAHGPVGALPVCALFESFALSVDTSGAVSFAGDLTPRKGTLNVMGLVASLTLAGTTARELRRALTGTLTFSGTVGRFYLKAARFFAGTLTFSGGLAKHTARALSGSVLFVGGFARRKLRRAIKVIEAAGFIFGK